MKYKSFYLLLILLLNSIVYSQGITPNKEKIYVWDFTSNNKAYDSLARAVTSELEEILTRSNCFDVLARKDLARLDDQIRNEKRISEIQDITPSLKKGMGLEKAEAVVFGSVEDDVNDQTLKIRVSLQRFNSRQAINASVRLSYGDAKSGTAVEEKAKKLASEMEICRAELKITDSNQPAAPLPAPIKNKVARYKSVTVQLDSIERQGGTVLFSFTITSKTDFYFKLAGDRYNYNKMFGFFSRIIEKGEEYYANEVYVGTPSKSNRESSETNLIRGVSVSAGVVFKDIPTTLTRISVLELSVNSGGSVSRSEKLRFFDLPIE